MNIERNLEAPKRATVATDPTLAEEDQPRSAKAAASAISSMTGLSISSAVAAPTTSKRRLGQPDRLAGLRLLGQLGGHAWVSLR